MKLRLGLCFAFLQFTGLGDARRQEFCFSRSRVRGLLSCRFTVFEFLAIAVCEGSFHKILANFYPRVRAHDFWQAELVEKRFCDSFVVLRFCAGFRVQVSVSICSFWKLNAEGVMCVGNSFEVECRVVSFLGSFKRLSEFCEHCEWIKHLAIEEVIFLLIFE